MGPSGAYPPDPAGDRHLLRAIRPRSPHSASPWNIAPQRYWSGLHRGRRAEDESALAAPDGVQINWLYRGGRADLVAEDRAGDNAAGRAVKNAFWLPGQVQVFIHGEAQAVMHNLRPYIRKERGVDAKWASIRGTARGRTEETFRSGKRSSPQLNPAPSSGLVSPIAGWHAHRMAFGDYQNEIYLKGLGGEVPSSRWFRGTGSQGRKGVAAVDLVVRRGGAGDERTQRANADVFQRWGLIPRCSSVPPSATCRSTCSG